MKACPACGKSDVCMAEDVRDAGQVVCIACGMRGPFLETRESAIAAWDALPRREDTQAEHARAERLAAYARANKALRDVDGEYYMDFEDGLRAWKVAHRQIHDRRHVLALAESALLPSDLGDGQEGRG